VSVFRRGALRRHTHTAASSTGELWLVRFYRDGCFAE